MAELVLSAFVLVVTMFMTMARFNIRKFLGYAAIVDVLFTCLMFWMFRHTYSGIVAGAFAGMFMTLLLYILRGTLGYQRLELKRKRRFLWRLEWVTHKPTGLNLKQGLFS